MRTLVALASVVLLASAFAEAAQKHQNDAFMQGPENEAQLAQEVRHQLLMLPYYSIFDDLYFNLNGSVVTLEGACPPGPPYDIRSDAENVVSSIGRSAVPLREPFTAIRTSEPATGTRPCLPFTSSWTTGT